MQTCTWKSFLWGFSEVRVTVSPKCPCQSNQEHILKLWCMSIGKGNWLSQRVRLLIKNTQNPISTIYCICCGYFIPYASYLWACLARPLSDPILKAGSTPSHWTNFPVRENTDLVSDWSSFFSWDFRKLRAKFISNTEQRDSHVVWAPSVLF